MWVLFIAKINPIFEKTDNVEIEPECWIDFLVSQLIIISGQIHSGYLVSLYLYVLCRHHNRGIEASKRVFEYHMDRAYYRFQNLHWRETIDIVLQFLKYIRESLYVKCH